MAQFRLRAAKCFTGHKPYQVYSIAKLWYMDGLFIVLYVHESFPRNDARAMVIDVYYAWKIFHAPFTELIFCNCLSFRSCLQCQHRSHKPDRHACSSLHGHRWHRLALARY